MICISQHFTVSCHIWYGYSSLPHISVVPRFSSLLHKADREGRINGAKVCPSAPSVCHLLFAHSSSILIHANRENALQLKKLLICMRDARAKWSTMQSQLSFFSKHTKRKCNKVSTSSSRAWLDVPWCCQSCSGCNPWLNHSACLWWHFRLSNSKVSLQKEKWRFITDI